LKEGLQNLGDYRYLWHVEVFQLLFKSSKFIFHLLNPFLLVLYELHSHVMFLLKSFRSHSLNVFLNFVLVCHQSNRIFNSLFLISSNNYLFLGIWNKILKLLTAKFIFHITNNNLEFSYLWLSGYESGGLPIRTLFDV